MADLTPDFHDGWFDGLKIESNRVLVFLRTVDNKPYIATASFVDRLIANEIRSGNIILEVTIRGTSEITGFDVDELFHLPVGNPLPKRAEILQRIVSGGMMLLNVTPSYGASCLVLARNIHIEPEPS